jgi:hypothetical protein
MCDGRERKGEELVLCCCCSLLIVVGQRLWFRLHVRCSFYHSIHKDNGGQSGTRSQVKKINKNFKDLERKYYKMGPIPIHVIISFCLCSLPFLLHLCPFNFGIPQSPPLYFATVFISFAFPLLSLFMGLIRAFLFCFA